MATVGIRGVNPIWLEADLTGHLFDDTFYMSVLQNTIPYNEAKVYHDINLTQPWSQPIWFLANGTLPLDIFWNPDPTLVYRLEFRQNDGTMPPSQADALIYEVDDYTPASGSSSSINTVATTTDNEFTNPQFALVNFTSPTTISVAGTYEIAPGWFLDLAGSGSAVISQVPFNNTNTNPSNAPYALRLQLSGWNPNSVKLRQRFQQNGMLWAGKYVSSAVTAATGSTGPTFQALTAILVDSNGNTLGTVLSVPIVNGSLTQYPYVTPVPLPASINPNLPPAAYIEYQLLLASTNDIYLTSFQILAEDLAVPVNFTQDTINRQIDHTFNYFKPQLFFKAIPSLLVGWDFPLNPAQINGTTTTFSTTPIYVWDQTICASFANTFNVVQTTSGAFQATNTAANDAFYMLQYLSGGEALEAALSNLSVNLAAFASKAATVNVYLFSGNASSSIPSLPTTLGTIDINGVFTLTAANWSLIALPFATNNTILINSDTLMDYPLVKWNAKANFSTQKNFAIVVAVKTPLISTAMAFQSISCVPGDIPTRPAPQTADDVLRECQYYYETTYDSGTAAGSTGDPGIYRSQQSNLSGGTLTLYPTPFEVEFNSVKRAAPNLILYTIITPGTAGAVAGWVIDSGGGINYVNRTLSSSFGSAFASTKQFYYLPANATGFNATAGCATNSSGGIAFHYVADARLGIV